MTVQEFFSIPQGTWLYNESKCILRKTNEAFNKNEEQIASLVSEILDGDKHNYFISTIDEFSLSGHKQWSDPIPLFEREDWRVIKSINDDIDNQKLINKVLWYFIKQQNDSIVDLNRCINSIKSNIDSIYSNFQRPDIRLPLPPNFINHEI